MLCGDLHSHTTWSDSGTSPGRRVISAMQVGNTVLAVTDHDTLRGAFAARKFIQEFDLSITIPTGIEFSTNRGHVLVYGLTHNPYEGRRGTPFSDVRRLADEQNGLLILAHPNWQPNRVAWESGRLHEQRLAGDFDAFEIINTVEDYRELLDYYDEHGPFPISCGSDCHHNKHRADATLWIPCDPGDEAGCLEAVRSGRVAVYASPELKGRDEPPFGEERWLGDATVIEAAKNLRRHPARNEADVQITFDKKTVFPGETLTLRLSCERAVRLRLRLPVEGIDQMLDLDPGTPWEHSFTLDSSLCNDYCYAVIQYTDGLDLADTYVALAPEDLRSVSRDEPAPKIKMPRFTSWENMPANPIALDTGDSATHAWAWDETHCYCQVEVNKPLHCQPYERNGLWEGDCVRLGVLPGNANPPCPPWEEINKKREPVPTPIDGALTPEGVKLSIHWKQSDGEQNGSRLSVTRDETKTLYRFAIRWAVLKLTAPKVGDILFCNGQLHLHDGTRYQGFAPFCIDTDLTNPPKNWLHAIIEK